MWAGDATAWPQWRRELRRPDASVLQRNNISLLYPKEVATLCQQTPLARSGSLGLPVTHNITETGLAHAVTIEGGRSTTGDAVSN